MTPEQQQRAERLASRLNFYASNGMTGSAYAICCELDALTCAAMAVRSFWALEVAEAGPDVPPDDRLELINTVTAAIRLMTVAASAMTVMEPLVRGATTPEVERALAWLGGPNSPCGPAGIQRFCEQIASGSPSADAATREMLQRIYDLSPDQPEGTADG